MAWPWNLARGQGRWNRCQSKLFSRSPSIAARTLSCIISETKRDTGRKSRFFSYPLHSMASLWACHRNTVTPFGTEKTSLVWLPDSEKVWVRMCIAVLTEYWHVTDRQTDILWQHSPHYVPVQHRTVNTKQFHIPYRSSFYIVTQELQPFKNSRFWTTLYNQSFSLKSSQHTIQILTESRASKVETNCID